MSVVVLGFLFMRVFFVVFCFVCVLVCCCFPQCLKQNINLNSNAIIMWCTQHILFNRCSGRVMTDSQIGLLVGYLYQW